MLTTNNFYSKLLEITFAPILPYDLRQVPILILDLTEHNKDLTKEVLLDTIAFTQYIFREMDKANALVAVGKYNEERIIYKRSTNFGGAEPRSIHLGIDLWAKTGTRVFCPFEGKIHSVKNNVGFGDYGPTIIIEHFIGDNTFFTLYGHLNLESIHNCFPGQYVSTGEEIGKIGNYPENGDWPPHLHFQLIKDLQGMEGDFPGVAAPSKRLYYLNLCPDPNIILKIPALPIE